MVLNYSAALRVTSNVKIKINFYQLHDWIQQNGGKKLTPLFTFMYCKMCLGSGLKKDNYNQNFAAGDFPWSDSSCFSVSHATVLRLESESAFEGLVLPSPIWREFLSQVLTGNQQDKPKVVVCKWKMTGLDWQLTWSCIKKKMKNSDLFSKKCKDWLVGHNGRHKGHLTCREKIITKKNTCLQIIIGTTFAEES